MLFRSDSQHYFEGDSIPTHVYARPLHVNVLQQIKQLYPTLVVASTDTGRAKWVESLAAELNTPAATIHKRRTAEGVSVASVSADVKGRCVVIFDDMIRSGNSLFQAVETYRTAGAARVFAIATHALFCGNFLANFNKSNIEHLYVTNTVPGTITHQKITYTVPGTITHQKITYTDVGPLLASAIRESTHE